MRPCLLPWGAVVSQEVSPPLASPVLTRALPFHAPMRVASLPLDHTSPLFQKRTVAPDELARPAPPALPQVPAYPLSAPVLGSPDGPDSLLPLCCCTRCSLLGSPSPLEHSEVKSYSSVRPRRNDPSFGMSFLVLWSTLGTGDQDHVPGSLLVFTGT